MKIEYSDLYKFLVSLGVGLLALAFVIPWLFLREPFDLLQTQESIEKLTPLAKSIIEQRQEYLATILGFIPYISIFLILTGIAFTVFGIIQWRSKSQWFADRRQQLELNEIEQALQPAKESDIEVKIQAEASEELDVLTKPEIESFAANARRIEKRVAQILQDCYRDDHKLLSNQRIGHAIFDFLLLSRRLPLSKYKNYTIEVKYVTRGFKFGWLRDNMLKTLYLSDIFEKETDLPSFPVLMIVSKRNVISQVETDQYINLLKSEMAVLGAGPSMVFMREEDLDEMQCEQLMALIDSSTL